MVGAAAGVGCCGRPSEITCFCEDAEVIIWSLTVAGADARGDSSSSEEFSDVTRDCEVAKVTRLHPTDPTVGSWFVNDLCISLSSLRVVNDKKHLFADGTKYIG